MKKIFNMKRIIQLLLVLGIVVQSLLFIENVKKQNVNHWYHLFDENSVTISLNEDNDVLSDDFTLEDLLQKQFALTCSEFVSRQLLSLSY